MMSPCAAAVAHYIRAKDSHHPWLMNRAFTLDATLAMTVRTDSIAFPPLTQGRAAITDVLVRDFGRRYENVFTFCLAEPPVDVPVFRCDWLVGMSEKDGGAVRVGCGAYTWQFEPGGEHLCTRLEIGIERMLSLPADRLDSVTRWLSSLSYPWCPRQVALRAMPATDDLAPVAECLRRAAPG